MPQYRITARSEDGLSGEDLDVTANSEEEAILKYEMGVGTELPVVTATLIEDTPS